MRRPPARRPSPRLLLGGASVAALLALGLAGLFLTLPRPPVSPTSRPAKPEPDMLQDAAALAQWARDVAALPVERQGDAVTSELRRRNPGFNGKVKCTVANGAVTGLDFLSDQVDRPFPSAGFTGLDRPELSGERRTNEPPLRPLAVERVAPDDSGLFKHGGRRSVASEGGQADPTQLQPHPRGRPDAAEGYEVDLPGLRRHARRRSGAAPENAADIPGLPPLPGFRPGAPRRGAADLPAVRRHAGFRPDAASRSAAGLPGLRQHVGFRLGAPDGNAD